MTVTVRFADLDPYDHVNHARYLSFFESARVELLEVMGFGMERLKRDGIQIVLTELTAGFHRSAGLHDRLVIATEVLEVRRASCRWRQEALRRSDRVATLDVTAAFTDLEGRPRRVPEGFSRAAARFTTTPSETGRETPMRLHNVVEDEVLRVVDEMAAARPEFCGCDKCRLDVAAYALVRLEPVYATARIDEARYRLEAMEPLVQARVVEGMGLVAAHPRH